MLLDHNERSKVDGLYGPMALPVAAKLRPCPPVRLCRSIIFVLSRSDHAEYHGILMALRLTGRLALQG